MKCSAWGGAEQHSREAVSIELKATQEAVQQNIEDVSKGYKGNATVSSLRDTQNPQPTSWQPRRPAILKTLICSVHLSLFLSKALKHASEYRLYGFPSCTWSPQ